MKKGVLHTPLPPPVSSPKINALPLQHARNLNITSRNIHLKFYGLKTIQRIINQKIKIKKTNLSVQN